MSEFSPRVESPKCKHYLKLLGDSSNNCERCGPICNKCTSSRCGRLISQ